MPKRKTKKSKSCPSGRKYASGKKKGRCVPKKVKAGKRKSWCYAKTRDQAIKRLDLYNKRAASLVIARAKRLEKKAEAAATQAVTWGKKTEAGAFWGLGRVSRRRRRHRR